MNTSEKPRFASESRSKELTRCARVASEAGHWYTASGECAYEVPNKSKPGTMRPTTLRDAKKLNLVPSVSGIIKQLYKPALEQWKIKNAVRYVMDHPYIGGENPEEYVSWVLGEASQEAGKAAETGTQIHAAIEQWLTDHASRDYRDYGYPLHVKAAVDALNEIGILGETFRAEKSFAHPLGYGGKIDLSCPVAIVDFKSKNGAFEGPFGYDEHVMQLAAYRLGAGLPLAKCHNVFVSVEQPGAFHVRTWTEDELSRGLQMFTCLVHLWQLTNNFTPVSK